MSSSRFHSFVKFLPLVIAVCFCTPANAVEVTLVSPPDGAIVNGTGVSFTCSATDANGLSSATLYIGSQPQTVTFSGAAQTDDAQISADNANTNYGGETSINVDGATPHAHGVIKFLDIFGYNPGQIPPGVSIVSATLEVNCTNTGNTMKLYRLTEDWVEGEVTWNERVVGVSWSNPGADGSSSNAGVPLNGDCSSTGWRTIGITQFMQEWSNGQPNYGIVLIDSGTDGVDFDTSESANPPILRVSLQTQWQPVGDPQPMFGTSDTVTFYPVTLDDQTSYVWNCLVTNTSGQASWAPADFRLTVDTHCPNEPVLVAPEDGETGVSTSPTLEVTVSDPDSDPLDVTFYGRDGSGEEFTIIALPDTQKYVLDVNYSLDLFSVQTQWIANNIDDLNIVFVTHEGDIVDVASDTVQWDRVRYSMSLIDPGLANLSNPNLPDPLVPYGVLPGNHDQQDMTTNYNLYFPYTHYTDRNLPWYGGHYPTTGNDNNYQLFSAGGEDYIIVHLAYGPGSAVFQWANGVLAANADRKAIITTHDYMLAGGARSTNGENIWNNLVVPNPNVYFVLCGHNHDEATTSDWVGDRQVHQLLADYQSEEIPGGNGWLRIMRFVPAEDKVYVQTYSPYLNQYEDDANSQFTLNFPMGGFSQIGSSTGVFSGSNASMVWTDLPMNTLHEWYVTVSDGLRTQTGPVWRFRTFSDDITAPIISGVQAVDVTDTSARIIWTTDEPADSLVEYGPDSGHGYQASDAALVVSHSITLADLTPNTAYYYRVTSRDSSNNSATSVDYTFMTLAEPPPVSNYASADYLTQIGSRAGSYVDTLAQDDSAEALTEAILPEGKPSNRHDELSHIWTFNVTGGNSVIFYVDACKTASSDGDNFVFSYSNDGIAYIDMLTITKTEDDDAYQTYTLPNTVEGVVYVRVRDTDRTPGKRSLDTVYIDHMCILCSGSVPDLPPAPPTGLTATGGDGQVLLDWNDNAEPDLAGYNLYRSATPGGGYVKQNGDLLPTSDYLDANVLNGTTYYYVVTAVEQAGQESAVSQEVSATPGAAPVMHVDSIVMSKIRSGKNWSAVATVTVLDEYNSPVEGTAVSYTWSGVHTGSGQALTGSNGVVIVTSSQSKTAGPTTFTVTGVLKAGCTYDAEGSVTSGTITGP